LRIAAIALAAILLTVAGLTTLGTGPASADTTATGATLTTTVASAPVGTVVPFTYSVSGPQVNAGNNLLWYPAGTSPTASNYASYEANDSEVYFSNASGTINSPTDNLSAGTYNVYIVADNEYAVLAGPVTVTLTSGGSVVTTTPVNTEPVQTGATLSAAASTFAVGSAATFQYSLPPGDLHSETVWIGWYPSGDSPTDEATYQDVLSNSQTVTTTSGTATFDTSSLSAGSYDVYLMSNKSTYDVLAGPVSVALTDTPPSAPTGVTATGYDSSVALSWNAASTASGYSVYDATASGAENTSGTPACTTSGTTCTVSGLKNNTTYYFVVVAANPIGSSPASSEASATPTPATIPPAAPAGLTAAPTGSAGVVNVSWKAVTDTSGYSVYDATSAGGEDTSGSPACTTTATTCTVTGLTDGTEYYFVVVATNSAGASGASAEASATPVNTPTATGVDGATLQTPSATVASGSSAAFTYSLGTGTASATNTVAWWYSGTAPTSTPPLYAFNQSAKSASGSVTFDTTGVEAGSYDVYLMSSSNTSILAGPLTVTVTGGTPQEPSPGQLAGQPNLIVNGGAEVGIPTTDGVDVTAVPGWQVSGTLTEMQYGVSGNPGYKTPGSADRGANFFTLANASGTSVTGTQTASVAAAAGAIDHGSVTYNLGGWLGGQGSATGTASVTATFLGGDGGQLGSATIGPVTEQERNGVTEFLPEHATGKLPAGTRRVQTVLTITSGAVGQGGQQGVADNLSFTISAPVPAPAPPTAPGVTVTSHVPRFQHVFTVMFENNAESDIIGNTTQAPYLNSLLSQGADLTSMHALSHPSDGNYNALISGGEWGSAGDNFTPFIDEQTIGDLVSNAGGTWRTYIQSANGPCDAEGSTGSGPTLYDVDESPFIHFDDLSNQDACQEHIEPLTALATDLKSAATTPNYVWFVGNDYYDMEGGGIKAGDTWFSQTLPEILNSPAWKDQRSLLIITFDEDAHDTPTNNVPTIILGSQGTVIPGSTSSTYYTSYSLLRTTEEALNLPPLTANDLYAGPVTGIWNQRDLDSSSTP